MLNLVLVQWSNLAVSLFPSMLTEAKVFIPNGLHSDVPPSESWLNQVKVAPCRLKQQQQQQQQQQQRPPRIRMTKYTE